MQSAYRIRISITLVSAGAALGCGETNEYQGLAVQESELIAWAALPYTERTPGPTSGQFSRAANGVMPPYVDAQPIPGWSGLLYNEDGTLTAMPDNGFGVKGTSGDFVLGFYVVTPKFKTRGDGTTEPGSMVINSFTPFHDGRGLLDNGRGIDFTITADLDNYFAGAGLGTDSGIAVDPDIRRRRLLTGYDVDVESITRAGDGTFWVGDEFGPFLLHFDASGLLIDEPIPHPFLKSPDHPDVLAGKATATAASSRGFESVAFDGDGRFLYAVTEAPSIVDSLRPVPGDERVVEIFELDPEARVYTGRTFKYRKDGTPTENAILIGDMTHVAGSVFALIERDNFFGSAAVVKRVYLINLNVTDADGILEKQLLIDVLDIDDPRDIGGDLPGLESNKFNLPFDSVECVHAIDSKTLGVAIDTNFPGQDARTPGVPDDTELIEIRFEHPMASYAPRPRR